MNQKTSFTRSLITLLLIIFIFPLGILMMWFWTKWPEWVKIFITIFIFLLMLVFPLIFYIFIAQPNKVVGSAMEPTLNDGDYILVDKFSYKLTFPVRGDIITFKYPKDESTDFLKRIIGIPGDKVMIKDGNVYINGQVLAEPYLSAVGSTNGSAFLENNQQIIVPADSYFVLGDNREHSSDSRNWGFVKRDEIIGRYWLTYYKAAPSLNNHSLIVQ